MRRLKYFAVAAFVAAVALLASDVRVRQAAAAYGNVVLTDGTNLWYFTASTIASTGILLVGGANGSPVTAINIDSSYGVLLPTTVTASLPTCNAAHKGFLALVSDATAPTYNGALTGGGAVQALVLCSGAAWLTH